MNFEGKAVAVEQERRRQLEKLFPDEGAKQPLADGAETKSPYDGEVARDFFETDDPKLKKARQDINRVIASQRRLMEASAAKRSMGSAHRKLAKTDEEMMLFSEKMGRDIYAMK
ncbi:MAG TPA: hypothetical protein VNW54_00485 [Granulicella sp.]|jgi:hypothetical protein|nr:hypothetical protein [Granulicella sp.]